MISADINVLKTDVKEAIQRLSAYRRGNKKKAMFVVILSASISASTTVAIGLAAVWSSGSEFFQGSALLLSASLTVLTAWDGLFNHKRLWLLQAGVVNSLYRIQTDVRHLEATDPGNQKAVNELYEKYKSAFAEYNSQWTEMREDEGGVQSTPKKDPPMA